MAKVSRETAQVEDYGPVVDRHADLDGHTVSFVSFAQQMDGAPLLRGLPDDRCQCPHWGYVFKGSVTFHYADHDEVIEEGEAFYAPPGHTPEHSEGNECLFFSPAEPLKETEAAMARNMQAMQEAQES